MSDSTCQHESVLFAEYGQVQDLISILTSECDSNDSEVRKEEALTSFRRILDRYLEFPTLLDPFLTSLVIPLAEYCRDHLENECCFYSLSAIYTISKVRGRKIIPRFFPHAMNLVEPVLNQLVIWSSHHTQQKDPNYTISISKNERNLPIWERMYVLWIWLDLLSLTPIDRHIVLHETTIPTIIKLSKEHLSESGPLRDTAASCLASWLAREDMQSHRIEFVTWSYDIWKDYPSSNLADFLPLGILQTLTTIFSKGSRSNYMDQLILWDCLLEVAEKHQVRNVLIRKYLVKWLTRMACAHMPPRLASWRYNRGGRRSLLDNLNHQEKTIPLVLSVPTGETIIHNENSEESLFYVPDAVEEAMGQLLLSLQDPATIVRWSASKGIGRITERLPSCCADDVLDALLRQLVDRNLQDQDTVWHGTCLTLGELTRRGLLLPHRLPDVLEPVLLPAIFFDRKKGTTSVGSHVRDAACYTYWAFARAYDPIILEPYVQRMSQALVVASLLDREINCRRAASAAFQESVGRQGAKNFPHGISILTTADYFTLGNRTDAYLNIAKCIAGFDEYRRPIIDHLYSIKLFHWDIDIRVLAAKSLHELTSMDKGYFIQTVVPNLLIRCVDSEICTRHGAVLGVSEIVLALFEDIPNDLNIQLSELVIKIESLRLYRGRGGEIMRKAVCRYIECISMSNIPLTVKQQVRLLDSVDENIKHTNESIQAAAEAALAALMRSYFPVGECGPSSRLQSRVVDKFIHHLTLSNNPAETRGYTRALGSLPRKLLAPSMHVLNSILTCLVRTARLDSKVAQQGDAETRQNAIQALVSIAKEVRFEGSEVPPTVGMSPQQLSLILNCFLLGLQDYNTDRRGDVGSWIRIASMSGLVGVIFLSLESHQSVELKFIITVIGELLKQLSEKLDNVRDHAGKCLEQLLQSQEIQSIIKVDTLRDCLSIGMGTNWSDSKVTYRKVVTAMNIPIFFHSIVSGLIVSVGALTESVTKYAEEALVDWIRGKYIQSDVSEGERVQKLGESLLKIFQSANGRSRMILPLLKTLEKLCNRGLLESLLSGGNNEFSSSILDCIKRETEHCQDVHRLLSGVSVALNLLSSLGDEKQNQRVLSFLLEMISHEFPRVRKHTADNLYVRLLEENSVIPNEDNADDILDLLLEGGWQNEDLVGNHIGLLCKRVAILMGVEFLPPKWTAVQKYNASASKKDDFSSYTSLVNSSYS